MSRVNPQDQAYMQQYKERAESENSKKLLDYYENVIYPLGIKSLDDFMSHKNASQIWEDVFKLTETSRKYKIKTMRERVFAARSYLWDDLAEEANSDMSLQIPNFIAEYRLDKGQSFASYLSTRFDQLLLDKQNSYGGQLSLSKYYGQKISEINKAKTKYFQKYHKEPSYEYLMKIIGYNPEDAGDKWLYNAFLAKGGIQGEALDAPLSFDEENTRPKIEGIVPKDNRTAEEIENFETQHDIDLALNRLKIDSVDKEILKEHHGSFFYENNDLSFKEIADKLGLKKYQVENRYNAVLKALRDSELLEIYKPYDPSEHRISTWSMQRLDSEKTINYRGKNMKLILYGYQNPADIEKYLISRLKEKDEFKNLTPEENVRLNRAYSVALLKSADTKEDSEIMIIGPLSKKESDNLINGKSTLDLRGSSENIWELYKGNAADVSGCYFPIVYDACPELIEDFVVQQPGLKILCDLQKDALFIMDLTPEIQKIYAQISKDIANNNPEFPSLSEMRPNEIGKNRIIAQKAGKAQARIDKAKGGKTNI